MLLGIVGGMGPRASAAFISTIYDVRDGEREQEYPRVVMLSDPTIPDRTQALLAGEVEPVRRALQEAVETVLGAGAGKVVICCFTAHNVVPLLPDSLQARIISLPDLAVEMMARSGQRCLMLCTTGSRKLGVFTRAPGWEQVEDRVAWLSEEDHDAFHHILYELKRGSDPKAAYEQIEQLCARHDCGAAVCGCTELHLVSRWLHQNRHQAGPVELIDALWEIATGLE